MATSSPRTLFSEDEAATMLGVSVNELRSMVRAHIVRDDEVLADSIAAFQSSDLLILKILSGSARASTAS